MTRKDYELIAAALRDARDNQLTGSAARFGVTQATMFIAEALARHNPKFNRSLFMDAAGVPHA